MQVTLLLRIALLAASSVANHLAMTSPNAVPNPEERAKYKAAAPAVGEGGFTIVHAATSVRRAVHFLNLLDLICLLSSAGFPIAHQLPFTSPQIDLSTIPPTILIGTLIMCISSVIRVVSYRYLGRYFTFHLSIKKDHKLVTGGPYAIVRHPGYTGLHMQVLGAGIAMLAPGSVYTELGLWRSTVGAVGGLVLLAMLVYISLCAGLRTSKEDLALKKEFKEEWEAWAARTPWLLIPGVY